MSPDLTYVLLSCFNSNNLSLTNRSLSNIGFSCADTGAWVMGESDMVRGYHECEGVFAINVRRPVGVSRLYETAAE